MSLLPLAIFLLACVFCGVLGRNTVFGFVGHFLLALLLTPIIDLLILLVARPRNPA